MKGEIFRQVPAPKVGYNAFDLSHSYRTTFNMGELIPTYMDEAVPGDKFFIRFENMFRTLPLVAPAFVNIKITQDLFFVPYRILWPEFEKWITGEAEVNPPKGNQLNLVQKGHLGDYMGLPIGVAAGMSSFTYSALPPAAYYKIYDEYYRDQNLITEKFTELISDNNAQYSGEMRTAPLKAAWHHDYFTSALPFAQKGDVVTLPILSDDELPVFTVDGKNQAGEWKDISDDTIASTASPTGLNKTTAGGTQDTQGTDIYYDPQGTLAVFPNSDASAITDIRRAFQLQAFLEQLARVGTRYTEFVSGIFSTFTGDARLNRPEWISRHTQQMQISEVLATAESVDVPVGNMAGHAISVKGSKMSVYKVKEHGIMMAITCIRPTTSYHQGLHKMWRRDTWLDVFIPHFENIGEQPILTHELYLGSDIDTEEKATQEFGYIPRYAEYKYKNDMLTGEMRDTLLYWNLSRDFSVEPLLNESFIECSPAHDIFAVTDPAEHKIIAHIYNNVKAVRPMQKFGSPRL